MNIVTHNPKLPRSSEFAFYVLSKGANAGKPLKYPRPNCFAIIADNKQEKLRLINYIYILWKANKFSPYLLGSVIPYLRIGDFKKVLFDTMNDKSINHENIWFVFSLIVSLKHKQDFFKQKIRNLRVTEKTYLRKYINI